MAEESDESPLSTYIALKNCAKKHLVLLPSKGLEQVEEMQQFVKHIEKLDSRTTRSSDVSCISACNENC
jgi:hypothetical protein